MELLELKSVWDVVVEDTISKERVDEFVVEKSIKKDSKSVLAKIKRVMLFKFAFGGLSPRHLPRDVYRFIYRT